MDYMQYVVAYIGRKTNGGHPDTQKSPRLVGETSEVRQRTPRPCHVLTASAGQGGGGSHALTRRAFMGFHGECFSQAGVGLGLPYT
jgi:hypothetical protein